MEIMKQILEWVILKVFYLVTVKSNLTLLTRKKNVIKFVWAKFQRKYILKISISIQNT